MSSSGPPPNPAPPSNPSQFVHLLQAYADYEPPPGLAIALRKTSQDVLRGDVEGKDLLEVLDPVTHGAGLLLVL